MEKNSLRLDNLLCKGFRLLLDFLSLAKAIELDRHLKKKLTSKGEIFLKKFFLLPSFFPPLHLEIFFFIRKTMAMNFFFGFFLLLGHCLRSYFIYFIFFIIVLPSYRWLLLIASVFHFLLFIFLLIDYFIFIVAYLY